MKFKKYLNFQFLTQVSKVQNNPSSLLHRSASSPAIIRIPASSLHKQGESALQGQIKLQTSQIQTSSTGGPRIIKITRLGGQGSSTIKVPMSGSAIPLSGVVNKTTGGTTAVKIGNYVSKNSAVPTINLNDLSGRTNGSGVPQSEVSKSGPDSIDWGSLVKKDPNTGACTINLANLAAASGKKIIITTTTGNHVTGSVVSQATGSDAKILSAGDRTHTPFSPSLGDVRMSPSVLPRSDILTAQTMRPRGVELPAPHSVDIAQHLNSLTSRSINAIQSPNMSLLQRNPPLQHSVSTPALSDLEQQHLMNVPNGIVPPNFKANVSHKDLSRLWSKEDVKLKKVGPSVQQVCACFDFCFGFFFVGGGCYQKYPA
jgi:hypothetical protein